MSLNDPQWGRRNGDDDRTEANRPGRGDGPGGRKPGPPDLDELWRDFNDRLAALFGRRSGGSGQGVGFRPPTGNLRQLGGGAAIIIGFLIAIWLSSGFFIVDARQRAVVLTFGKYTRTASEGLNWRWPWPAQAHELIDVQSVRKVVVGYSEAVGARQGVSRESLMLTKNLNIVDVQFEVQYVAVEPQLFVFTDRVPSETVKQVAETAIREVVGNNEVDFVLYGDRTAIQDNTRRLMQDILNRYKVGVEVRSVNIQGVNPPEPVRAAFDDVVKARQDSARFVNEGEAYANGVIPGARGTASRLLQEANGYRESTVANAQGEASRFRQVLAEYQKAPGVTRERMYISAMQDVLSSTTKVIVDAKGQGNLLFLPLDRLMQQAGTAAAVAAGAGDPVPVPGAAPRPQANDTAVPGQPTLDSGAQRSRDPRDLSRSRDRESR
jgi:membrane protease subunit HflK